MTDNIKPTVQEKTAWAKAPQEFNDWWNGDYSDESNPFRLNSAAYWAWAGWSEAVRLNAQATTDEPDWRHPKIQGLIGSEARLRITIDLIWQILEDPEQEFTASDMEYWDTIHDKLKAAMLSAAPAAPQPARTAQPLDLSVMELAESVGLIGPASRTDDLHEAIQRFHDLIVVNASIKAARHFADGLAQPAQQPLTDEQIQDVVTRAVSERKLSWLGFKKDDWDKYTIPVLSPSDYQFARAIEQAHGIGVKND